MSICTCTSRGPSFSTAARPDDCSHSRPAPGGPTRVDYRSDDLLVFGSETRGLPDAIRAAYADSLYTIPMPSAHVRSLNLSNAAAIVLYEALRQLGRV